MPIGVLVNVLSVGIGALLGSVIGGFVSERIKANLPTVFAYCALAIGINSVIKVVHLPVVILSIVIGFVVGEILHLETLCERCFSSASKKILPKGASLDMELFITAVALFCASGLGIFGALSEGMSGEASILFSKSILDFFTAIVFAISLGAITAIIAVPQLAILLFVFFIARAVSLLITPEMMADFTATGGLLTIATAFRMGRIKTLPIINLIPALIIVFPLSRLWVLLFS